MKETSLRYMLISLVISIGLFLLVFYAFWMFLWGIKQTRPDFGGRSSYDVYTISDMSGYSLNKGDSFEFIEALPVGDYTFETLKIEASGIDINVYLDDKIVYEYSASYDLWHNNLHLVKHFVNLEQGNMLKILIKVANDDAAISDDGIIIGDVSNMIYTDIHKNIPVIGMGLFFMMYGLILIVSSLYNHYVLKKDLKILITAIISFFEGINLTAKGNLFTYLFGNYIFNLRMHFFTHYILPVGLALFMFYVMSGKLKNIYKWMLVLNSTLYLALIGVSNYVPDYFLKFLYISNVVFVIEAAIMLYSLIYNLKFSHELDENLNYDPVVNLNHRFSIVTMSIGLCALLFESIAHMIVGDKNKVIPVVCAVIFSICQFVYYFFCELYDASKQRNIDDLKDLIYIDPLTGLFNRSKYEHVMEKIEKEKSDYTIVSIDVNDLKMTNDSFGHAEGDRLIREFAKLLKDAFDENDLVVRMGGDEFVVVTQNKSESNLNYNLDKFKVSLDEKTKSDVLNFKAAYGIASSTEFSDVHYHDIYMVADKRMYDMKDVMHKMDDEKFKQTVISVDEERFRHMPINRT